MAETNKQFEEGDCIFCKGCGFEWELSELDMFLNSEGEIKCQCPECTSSTFAITDIGLYPYLEEYQEGWEGSD